jgi:hypothetical protein
VWNALIGTGNGSNGDADKRMEIQFDHEKLNKKVKFLASKQH